MILFSTLSAIKGNRNIMKSVSIVAFIFTAFCVPVFGNSLDLNIAFSPSILTYPPGSSPIICELNGDPGACLIYSGTITDNDTDGSIVNLTDGIALLPLSVYVTLDNLFFNDVPGCLEGDTLDNVCPNSYTGPIFGIGIAPGTPFGTYSETFVLSVDGGTADPTNSGQTFDATVQIQVVPEPASAVTLGAGLVVLAFSCRKRHTAR
jgi:hypothetical protein